MTTEFIEQRRRALQVFINRVVSTAAVAASQLYKAMPEAWLPVYHLSASYAVGYASIGL